MYGVKSIVDILPILVEMVREGIWESQEEAVEEFKLRRERRGVLAYGRAVVEQ